MKTLWILAILILSGCASDGIKVMWYQLPNDELQQVCRRGMWPVVGCAKPGPLSCHIYTLEVSREKREDLHETLGHELRHCFEGKFHH
jgi:hypothetical protein